VFTEQSLFGYIHAPKKAAGKAILLAFEQPDLSSQGGAMIGSLLRGVILLSAFIAVVACSDEQNPAKQ
jgi:hypothetical protein